MDFLFVAAFIGGSASDDFLSEIVDFIDGNRGRAGIERAARASISF